MPRHHRTNQHISFQPECVLRLRNRFYTVLQRAEGENGKNLAHPLLTEVVLERDMAGNVVLCACKMDGPLLACSARRSAENPEVVVVHVDAGGGRGNNGAAVDSFESEDDFFQVHLHTCVVSQDSSLVLISENVVYIGYLRRAAQSIESCVQGRNMTLSLGGQQCSLGLPRRQTCQRT